MKTCPGCPDCDGIPHHWLHDVPKGSYSCKHCPAVGEECPVCEGSGGAPSELDDVEEGAEWLNDLMDDCPTCSGVGVAERGGMETS